VPGDVSHPARQEIGGKRRPWSVLPFIIHLKTVKKKVRTEITEHWIDGFNEIILEILNKLKFPSAFISFLLEVMSPEAEIEMESQLRLKITFQKI
jgi:hypothetical protein